MRENHAGETSNLLTRTRNKLSSRENGRNVPATDERMQRVPEELWARFFHKRWRWGRDKFAIRDYIRKLDAQKDYEIISFLSTAFDFPYDTQRSLELALVRTFCVPRSSDVLIKTGEFTERPQKRYDDTVLLLSEILEFGMDSQRGRAATRRMNQLHNRYPISNEEFLYVLTTFVFEPIRWNEKYGWRELTRQERLAAYYYWLEMGHRMNIKNIPPSIEELEKFNREYEEANFAYSEVNRRLGDSTVELMLGWYPAPLRPLTRKLIYAMMDDLMLKAFGFPQPRPLTRKLVLAAFKVRAGFMRFLPSRSRPRLLTAERTRSYPDGYEVTQLGPQFPKRERQG